MSSDRSAQPGEPNDFDLMRAIAAGDRGALEKLYDRHSPRLFGLCLRILHDRGEAEDVLADIFFEVWTRAARFDAGRGSPITYLLTLTRSRAIDRKRGAKHRPAQTDQTISSASVANPQLDPAQIAGLAEQCRIIRQALATLSPDQQQALECAFYEGLSHSEIAEKLNRPLGTIKTFIRQGLIHLRQCLRNKQ